MTRMQINRWAATTPLFLSGVAFLLAFGAGVTGWERNLPHEGAGAHLFQLSIAAQIPILVLFLWTADRSRSIAKWLALDLAGIAFACAPVALFRL